MECIKHFEKRDGLFGIFQTSHVLRKAVLNVKTRMILNLIANGVESVCMSSGKNP